MEVVSLNFHDVQKIIHDAPSLKQIHLRNHRNVFMTLYIDKLCETKTKMRLDLNSLVQGNPEQRNSL